MSDEGGSLNIPREWSIVFNLLILSLSAITIYAAMEGAFEIADHLASIITGLATVALVYVTYYYVDLTNKLVGENKQARLEEQQRRQRARERELTSLRRGLLYEIQAGDDLEFFKDGVSTGKEIRRPAPTTIYEQNTDRIGRLTDTEIDAIVEYYSLIQKFEDQLYLRNETNRGSVINTIITPAEIESAEQRAVDALQSELEGNE